jgi:hypothetical protein
MILDYADRDIGDSRLLSKMYVSILCFDHGREGIDRDSIYARDIWEGSAADTGVR